ncbi:hypothetical protein [Ornithinimicrobium sp. Y1694]|uniref:hypothetical protein n=1 Tax=Ornithinimicrobium sp. Y1694 TaxID=3418590 RepID=UPI003CEFB799
MKVIMLGALTFMGLVFLAPWAWANGRRVLREMDASPVPIVNRRFVWLATMFGMVYTCMFGLLIVWICVMVVLMEAGIVR